MSLDKQVENAAIRKWLISNN